MRNILILSIISLYIIYIYMLSDSFLLVGGTICSTLSHNIQCDCLIHKQWSKFKSEMSVLGGKLGFLIINKWASRGSTDFQLSVLFSSHSTECFSSSGSTSRAHTTPVKQMAVSPGDALTFKSRPVSGRTLVWIQKQIGKWFLFSNRLSRCEEPREPREHLRVSTSRAPDFRMYNKYFCI